MKALRLRYVARRYTLGPRSEAVGIYDRERGSWPVLHAGLRVPGRFGSEEEAQAWADEHLNG